MKKAGTRWIFLLVAVAGLQAQARWRSDPDITLIAVPRDPVSIRIAMEMEQRYPVLLVSYQQARGQIRLHAWNGESWVAVSEEDYAQGNFFRRAPAEMIVIHGEDDPLPGILIPEGLWCPSIYRLASTDPRVMLHLLGRHFDVPYRVWRDLTWRYRYTMEEINPGHVNVPWWHFRARDVYQARAQRNLAADLDKWYYLEVESPEALGPVEMDVVDPEPVDLEDVEDEVPAEPAAPEAADPVEKEKEDLPEREEVSIPVRPFDVEDAEPDAVLDEAADFDEEDDSGEEVGIEYVTDPFSEGEVKPAEVIDSGNL